jgi:hypothetical protein
MDSGFAAARRPGMTEHLQTLAAPPICFLMPSPPKLRGQGHDETPSTCKETPMSKPLIVSIPHRLGKDEALRRIKSGLGTVRTSYGQILAIEEETWTGDRLAFHVAALGQRASGTIDVRESDVQLEVTLPWLLHKLAERITPTIRKEGVLMLEKK